MGAVPNPRDASPCVIQMSKKMADVCGVPTPRQPCRSSYSLPGTGYIYEGSKCSLQGCKYNLHANALVLPTRFDYPHARLMIQPSRLRPAAGAPRRRTWIATSISRTHTDSLYRDFSLFPSLSHTLTSPIAAYFFALSLTHTDSFSTQSLTNATTYSRTHSRTHSLTHPLTRSL